MRPVTRAIGRMTASLSMVQKACNNADWWNDYLL